MTWLISALLALFLAAAHAALSVRYMSLGVSQMPTTLFGKLLAPEQLLNVMFFCHFCQH